MTTTRIKFTIKGRSKLLMHNEQLANPMNAWTKLLKEATKEKKRKGVDQVAALEKIAKLEFAGSLYLNDEGRPVIRQNALRACVTAGARQYRQGKTLGALSFDSEEYILNFTVDGAKADLCGHKALWEANLFDQRMVKVGQARVLRTRPCFKGWSCAFTVDWADGLLNAEDLIGHVTRAGSSVGLLDGRSIGLGRFDVTEAKVQEILAAA
ncbi:MAG TPA: hypothetical protein EYF98_11790 [Planctomycetes bacterium]|nr:hypothetical protein [Planctomycetota bacterium]